MSVWVSYPGYVTSQPLTYSSLLAFGGWVAETVLMLFKHCLALAKTLGCYQHFSSNKCKAQHSESCYGECQFHTRQILYSQSTYLREVHQNMTMMWQLLQAVPSSYYEVWEKQLVVNSNCCCQQ